MSGSMAMARRVVAALIAMLMVTDLVAAGEDVTVKTNWTGFQEQVAQRKLRNRRAHISLASGGEVKTILMRVEENGIVVGLNRETRQWTSGKQEALVPRQDISSVRFDGKTGRGGLIGGLAGLGAGAAATAGAAAGMGGGNCEGSSCGAVILLIPVAAVCGWLVGRTTQKPAPVFVIQQ